jgi:hypothetical protein
VFFRDKTQFPLSFSADKKAGKLDYRGYKLINRYPEFHYTINGIDVYELILPKADGKGLNRTFRIPNVKSTVWFNTDQSDGVKYEALKGSWEGNRLKLTSKEAREFCIIMSIKEGGLL